MVVLHTSPCGSQGRRFRDSEIVFEACDGLITYTDDYYGVSQRDVEMARRISAAARRLGLSRGGRAVSRRLSRAATRSDPT